MAIERPGKTVRCSGCGKTGDQLRGANNWVMCDTCYITYCSSCYRSIRKSSTSCTDHRPWGKWLKSGGTFATMVFK